MSGRLAVEALALGIAGYLLVQLRALGPTTISVVGFLVGLAWGYKEFRSLRSAVPLALLAAFGLPILDRLLRSGPRVPTSGDPRPNTSTMASTNGLNGHSKGNSKMTITKRPWNARGHADHGWL